MQLRLNLKPYTRFLKGEKLFEKYDETDTRFFIILKYILGKSEAEPDTGENRVGGRPVFEV